MSANYETFYAIRVERIDFGRRPTRRPVYVGGGDRFAPVSRAREFDTIDAAETHIRQRGDRDRYRFLVEFCTRENRVGDDDPQANFLQQLMAIPYPYRRTAYNWVRGRDVASLLRRESEEVYDRHRRLLLDYDIDITMPSPVVIMKPRRGRIRINTGDTPVEQAPKRYFVPRAQRPTAAPEPLHLDAPESNDADDKDRTDA